MDGNKKGFFTNSIGEKMMDLQNQSSMKMGMIGPNLPKDRLLQQFKKKHLIDDFKQKRFDAESNLKINLTDEIRHLNKWIQEYEDLIQFKKPSQSSSIKDTLIKKMQENADLEDKNQITRK